MGASRRSRHWVLRTACLLAVVHAVGCANAPGRRSELKSEPPFKDDDQLALEGRARLQSKGVDVDALEGFPGFRQKPVLQKSRYSALVTTSVDGYRNPRYPGPIRKKLLVITEIKFSQVGIDWLVQSLLPEEFQPNKPADVGALVWLEHDWRAIGSYVSGGVEKSVATTTNTEAYVVDIRSHEVIAAKMYLGSNPKPILKAGETAVAGSGPIRAPVADWLKSLDEPAVRSNPPKAGNR